MQYGINSKDGHPECVRSFCLSLDFYSPRAYKYVREKFNRNLPHKTTLRSWYRNCDIDASPGICYVALDILARASSKMHGEGKQLVCNLVFDEMAIHTNLQWSNSTQSFLGFITPIFDGNKEDLPLATNAIVFMVCGVNMVFQQPVAYFFIKSLKGGQRSDLLLQILRSLSARDILISSVTFDGLIANATMCALLGAQLNEDLKPSFHNPYEGNDVHIIYDPSHMIKLVRNNLSKHAVLYDGENRKVEWKYFELLETISRESNLVFTHKLRRGHIQWRDREMNVRLAVETISNSVAQSMNYLLQNGHPAFKNAGPTIEFVRIFDRLFDVMNTMHIRESQKNAFKSALNPDNKEVIFTFLTRAKEYISSLQIEHDGSLVPILGSRMKTGFRGFLSNIMSSCNV